MLCITDAGTAVLLEGAVKSGPLTLGLYTNAHTPSAKDTIKSYQEPSGGGYAPKVLSPKLWGMTGSTAVCVEQPFTFTGVPNPAVVQGYFVKRGDVVVWAEPFDKPFVVRLKGDTISVVLSLTLRVTSADKG